jgi:hypothetical protein
MRLRLHLLLLLLLQVPRQAGCARAAAKLRLAWTALAAASVVALTVQLLHPALWLWWMPAPGVHHLCWVVAQQNHTGRCAAWWRGFLC